MPSDLSWSYFFFAIHSLRCLLYPFVLSQFESFLWQFEHLNHLCSDDIVDCMCQLCINCFFQSKLQAIPVLASFHWNFFPQCQQGNFSNLHTCHSKMICQGFFFFQVIGFIIGPWSNSFFVFCLSIIHFRKHLFSGFIISDSCVGQFLDQIIWYFWINDIILNSSFSAL